MSTFRIWLHGLLAALISGGANGLISGFALMGIDAEHFNAAKGLHSLLLAAGTVALTSGILGAAAYLKQSPVPAEPEQKVNLHA